MTDHYLAKELAGPELAGAPGAAGLLAWASAVAATAQPADVFRNKEGRKTLRFHYRDRSWFLKLHTGVGWREIFKNLLQARLPVISATNEYRAVAALRRAGVDTLSVAAYARQGINPAAISSMLVTADLVDTISLEHYCASWVAEPPPAAVRLRLVRKLADSARRMHEAGINHRDFYICHFHLDPASLCEAELRCYLIDLHRAQMRSRTPRRWQVKDLAGLYFSAMDCGLTARDLLRFLRHYNPGGVRAALGTDERLWRQVEQRARALYRRSHGCEPPTTDAVRSTLG